MRDSLMVPGPKNGIRKYLHRGGFNTAKFKGRVPPEPELTTDLKKLKGRLEDAKNMSNSKDAKFKCTLRRTLQNPTLIDNEGALLRHSTETA